MISNNKNIIKIDNRFINLNLISDVVEENDSITLHMHNLTVIQFSGKSSEYLKEILNGIHAINLSEINENLVRIKKT